MRRHVTAKSESAFESGLRRNGDHDRDGSEVTPAIAFRPENKGSFRARNKSRHASLNPQPQPSLSLLLTVAVSAEMVVNQPLTPIPKRAEARIGQV